MKQKQKNSVYPHVFPHALRCPFCAKHRLYLCSLCSIVGGGVGFHGGGGGRRLPFFLFTLSQKVVSRKVLKILTISQMECLL